jgi:hypothetical protein
MAHARFICRSSRAGSVRLGAPLWRLVGANNRELGRAPATVVNAPSCCGAVAWLQAKLPAAVGRVKPTGPANSWTWSVECDGELLAVSGRTYLRQRECQYSLWQFLAAAAVAAVVEHNGHRLCADEVSVF